MTVSVAGSLRESPSAPRLVGMIPSGMLDWPGRIAATVFVAGCTMRCPYCHNPEIVTGRASHGLRFEDVVHHLAEKRGWIDGIVVTGGEPTADAALIPMLEELKAISVPVKLDTNGSLPDVVEEILGRNLVEFVALDIKAAPHRYDQVTGLSGSWNRVERSLHAILGSGVEHELRTTCYPLAVTLADLDSVATAVVGGRRLVLQQFRQARTLDPAASSVRPYAPEALRSAAVRCSTRIPTVVRGT